MSETTSEQIMARLRADADERARPKERHGTLDRLKEACDEIASGRALKVVQDGFPEAAFNFRMSPVLVKPPRIEEFVLARRGIDARARRKSEWVGPMSTTIRKDTSLLEYVRMREQEQLAVSPMKVTKAVERCLDDIEDLGLRAEIRFRLARAAQVEQDLRRLKEGMRRMRPTIDVDALVEGRKQEIANDLPAAQSVAEAKPSQSVAQLVSAVSRLTDPRSLSKCGLVYNVEFGNVTERSSRFELLTADEVRALRWAAGLGPSTAVTDS